MIHTAPSAFEAAHWERANRRQAHIERLENGITELSAHIYAATYRLLELIRELTLYEDDDGSFVVHGRLTPEQGALVKKALEAGMNEDFKEQKNVPAGTLLHCVPLMPLQASTIFPKSHCGVNFCAIATPPRFAPGRAPLITTAWKLTVRPI
jgi:hypothetical protein